jgi:uncharacterized protein YcbK (DUF882 family)
VEGDVGEDRKLSSAAFVPWIITTAKGNVVRLSTHFTTREFECKCKRSDCRETKVDQNLIHVLQELRSTVGRAIVVTSGYRCEAHNAAVGGSPNSQHKRGTAADIVIAGETPEQTYERLDPVHLGGLGRYDTFTHVDTRPTRVRFDMRQHMKGV